MVSQRVRLLPLWMPRVGTNHGLDEKILCWIIFISPNPIIKINEFICQTGKSREATVSETGGRGGIKKMILNFISERNLPSQPMFSIGTFSRLDDFIARAETTFVIYGNGGSVSIDFELALSRREIDRRMIRVPKCKEPWKCYLLENWVQYSKLIWERDGSRWDHWQRN